jgi:hypothetical protein
MSMKFKEGEEARFDHAKRIAQRLVQDARQGDATSLIMIGAPPRVVIGAPAIAREAVRSEIQGLEATDGGVDLVATFERVEEVLATSDIPRKEVVFLTDLQTSSWQRASSAGEEKLRKVFERLEAKRVRSQVIDLGSAGAQNRAVTDLAVSPAVPTVGAPVTVRATIRNFGTSEIASVPVRFAVGGRVASEVPIRLEAGEEQSVATVLRFNTAGETFVTVGLPDDQLVSDDVRRLAVPVRESIGVLLVDGDPKREAFRSEVDFLAEAIDPGETSPGEPRPIRVERTTEAQFGRRDLTGIDVVVLCNVARLTEVEVASLDVHLRQGGGMVIFGGDRVEAENYNRMLFADGQGLLPARFGPVEGEIGGPAAPLRFDGVGFKHPIISAFAGQSPAVQASLTEVKTFRIHRLELPKSTTAQVAMRFSNDAPAIIDWTRHRGRVFQIATTANQDWTTWPLHPSWVPVMEAMIAEAASGRSAEINVRVGQPLVRSFSSAAAGTEAEVRLPSGKVETVTLTPDGDVSTLKFVDTMRAGSYSATIGPPVSRTVPFGVNPETIESDLSHLDSTALKASFPKWSFLYDNDWRPYQESAAAVGDRGELHRVMLWAILVLLILETILAVAFGHHANVTRTIRQELLFLISRLLPAVLIGLVLGSLLLGPAISTWLPALLIRLQPAGSVAPAHAGEALTPKIRFDQPWGQLALAATLVSSVLLIVGLYRREGAAKPRAQAILSALRILVVLLAVFMLAEPELLVERTGLPYFVIMIDESASSGVTDRFEDPKIQSALAELGKSAGAADPARLSVAKGWLTREDQRLWKSLLSEHRIKLYGVSNQARSIADISEVSELPAAVQSLGKLEAKGDESRLGDGVRQVISELRGATPTAIVLLSDGRGTAGESIAHAAELARQKGVPIFPVGLGDANPPRDLELTDLQVDEVVFVDDLVRFEAKLHAHGFSGQNVPVVLRRKPANASDSDPGVEVARRDYVGPRDGETLRVELVDRPKQTGSFTYIVEIEPQPRELRTDNNRLVRDVVVREEKLRVLLIDTEPRYEFRYLKNFLEREKTIDLHVLLLASDPEYSEQDRSALAVLPPPRDTDGGLFTYDVVILGDSDPDVLSESQMQNLADFVVKKGGGLLFVAGQRFNPLAYERKPLEVLLPVKLSEARDPVAIAGQVTGFRPALTVEGRSHPVFRLDDDEAVSQSVWATLPPLFWYLEAPHKKPTAFVLAEHPEIVGADGKLPLVLYQYVGAGKVIFQAFDDTWRWRFRNGDRYFGRYWIQTIRFLARNRLLGQKPAEITTDRRRYTRAQPILVQVRFLNQGLAPDGEVSVQIERKGSPPRRLSLRRSDSNPSVFEGVLPQSSEGEYEARLLPPPVLAGGLPSTKFQVDPPAGEFEDIRMNEPELRQAAEITGGRFISPASGSIDDLLKDLPAPRKVPLETDPPIAIWNTWPLLLAFVLIITLEWVCRKREQLV